jgi:hypothetical protein
VPLVGRRPYESLTWLQKLDQQTRAFEESIKKNNTGKSSGDGYCRFARQFTVVGNLAKCDVAADYASPCCASASGCAFRADPNFKVCSVDV